MSELISKVSVNDPSQAGTFTNEIAMFLDGKVGEVELITKCKNLSSEKLQQFIDELNGEACLYCVGMSGLPKDDFKANRLFNLVALLETQLQGVGYRNSDVGCGGSRSVDFPQENQECLTLPDELKSPKAQVYGKRLQEAGYVTSKYRPLGSKTQMAAIAYYFSIALGLHYRYKSFAKLWDYKEANMQTLYSKIDKFDDLTWYEEIKKLFTDT